MDWFLYDNGPGHERVNIFKKVNENHYHVIRQTTINSVTLPQPRIEYYGKYFVKYQSAYIWNSMKRKRSIDLIEERKSKVKSVLFKYFMTIYST